MSNVEGEQYASLLLVKNAIRNFLLYRHLAQIYLTNTRPLNVDFTKLQALTKVGNCNDWKINDLIDPLPSDQDSKYQSCLLRLDPKKKRDYEKVVMLSDVQHVVLIKADFSNKSNIKGTMVFRCTYRSILGVYIDRKEPKRITL